jgi:sugar lactone lactonase YvrE
VFLLAAAATVQAGHETPCFIDPCQSADGRYVVTAAPVGKPINHGPNRWQFTWKDTQTGEARTFDAQGVQGGQIHAQLFVPPGGKTFALFNHVTMWTAGKSDMHLANHLPAKAGDPQFREMEIFRNRLIIYRSDGSIIKALGVGDFVQEDEWPAVLPVFTRVHWIKDYPGRHFKKTPRVGYAFYNVSPDYSVLEFRVVPTRTAKDKAGRVVRVSLTDGRILAPDEALPPERTPVKPFIGPDEVPAGMSADEKDAYQPALDPVRVAGVFAPVTPKAPPPQKKPSANGTAPAAAPAANASPLPAKLQVWKEGLAKADTPVWLPTKKALAVADLDRNAVYALGEAGGELKTLLEEGVRVRPGPDGRLYGVIAGQFSSWTPGEAAKPIARQAAGGKPFSVNDLVVTPTHAYLTTLKDPEKGRLSIVNLKTGEVAVAFDGEQEADLANPNGVAVSPDGKWLYVGISNYKNRGKSGVYRFPRREDGSIDVAAGKAERWAPVQGPDGIIIAPDGSVCFTAGSEVLAYSPEGKKLATVKIPKGSGTNLCFGGEDGGTLFVTTNNAVYAGQK